MAQKHRVNSEIKAFSWPVWVKKEVAAEVARQKLQSKGAALTVNSWLLRAVLRDLAHSRRSRRTRKSALEMDRNDGLPDHRPDVGAEAPAPTEAPTGADSEGTGV